MKTKSMCFSLLFVLILPILSYATTLHWASGVRMTPEKPKSGDTVTLQAIVASRQNETDFQVVAGVGGQELFNRAFKILEAGKSRTIRFRWKALAGNYSAYFKIIPRSGPSKQSGPKKMKKDPLLISKRFSVGTQKLSTKINPKTVTKAERKQPECQGTPLPDIVTTHVQLGGGYSPGDEISVTAVFENRGQCATGFFSARAEVYIQNANANYFETVNIGKVMLPSIKPCTSKTCKESKVSTGFKFKTLDKPYVYYEFSVYPDFDHQVQEFNEKNNDWVRKSTITVQTR